MTTITEDIDLPDGTDPALVRVTLQLWGNGTPVTGYETATGVSIAGVAFADGTPWEIDGVVGNDAIDAPTGTVYRVTRTWPGLRDPLVDYLDVPDAGGPFRVDEILTDPPATIESSALALGLATKVDLAGDTMTGPLVVDADATITGVIKTGTFGTPATFGGIEREARVFPAGAMMSPTGVVNFGDGFPRVNMPANVTTDVYMIFEVEEWWLDSTIGVYFEWSNDHTTTGDVRFDCDVKECDIATETLAAADVIATRTFTAGSAAANVATTSIVARVTPEGLPCSFDPGPFASFYRLRITRLGGDAADTLAGPIGLIAASMTRGQ